MAEAMISNDHNTPAPANDGHLPKYSGEVDFDAECGLKDTLPSVTTEELNDDMQKLLSKLKRSESK